MQNKKEKSRSKIAVMLILLLTFCVISAIALGVYAKYHAENGMHSGARVAKFGIEISTEDDTGFSQTYETDNHIELITNSVASSNNALVVAPGTKGNLSAIKFSGTPEVAVAVNFVAHFAITNWTIDDGSFYCPIEITIDGVTIKGIEYNDNETFEQAVTDKISQCSANYDAMFNMSGAKSPNISWEWKFDGNDDKKDTQLGNSSKNPIISLQISITVTQID